MSRNKDMLVNDLLDEYIKLSKILGNSDLDLKKINKVISKRKNLRKAGAVIRYISPFIVSLLIGYQTHKKIFEDTPFVINTKEIEEQVSTTYYSTGQVLEQKSFEEVNAEQLAYIKKMGKNDLDLYEKETTYYILEEDIDDYSNVLKMGKEELDNKFVIDNVVTETSSSIPDDEQESLKKYGTAITINGTTGKVKMEEEGLFTNFLYGALYLSTNLGTASLYRFKLKKYPLSTKLEEIDKKYKRFNKSDIEVLENYQNMCEENLKLILDTDNINEYVIAKKVKKLNRGNVK